MKNVAQRRVLLLGASGQIGSAIRNALQFTPAVLTWEEAARARIGGLETLRNELSRVAAPLDGLDVVVACGVTDAALPVTRIMESNFLFPRDLITALAEHDTRIVTLGTIQENFEAACQSNPYLRSKWELGAWVRLRAERLSSNGKLLHLRLHTVYSDAIKPHLFLGAMFESIGNRTPFRMSAGTQLREYHHADDIGVAIEGLLATQWPGPPALELSSGAPVRLGHLARAVFKHFDLEHLLEIGALETPAGENIDRIFPASSRDLLPRYRDPITGVIGALEHALRRR